MLPPPRPNACECTLECALDFKDFTAPSFFRVDVNRPRRASWEAACGTAQQSTAPNHIEQYRATTHAVSCGIRLAM